MGLESDPVRQIQAILRSRAFRRVAEGILLLFLQGLAAPGQSAGSTRIVESDAAPGILMRASAAEAPPKTLIPPGTVLYLRLETPVSTKSSHLRDAVTARVVRGVPGRQGIAIPLGALVRGSIEKLIPSSNPTDRARMLSRFTRLEVPGEPPIALVGHIAQIENARESVLPDGTIQGILASELPLTHLERALEKLGRSNAEIAARVEKIEKKAFGQSDTSVEYPVGTDLQFVLDEAVTVKDKLTPAASDQLGAAVCASVKRLLEQAPQRASDKGGQPGDPLNLVMVGSEEQIRRAFREAGWTEAEKATAKSVWETVRALAADQGFGAAPVSQLYLYGRPEDLAFEKMLNTFTKRHHLRLWRSPVSTSEGREIWLGAATHDTGLEVRPGVISHAIEADLDNERAKVGADLMVSGRVAGEMLLTRLDPLTEGLTATGTPWKTDGRLLAIELKPE